MFIRRSDPGCLRRFGVACVGLFHIGAAAALGTADAILDAELAITPVHIESPGSADCASHHGHLCQLVRSLSLADISDRVNPADSPAPPVRHCGGSREATFIPSSPIMSGPVVPRGPPTI